MVGQSKVGAWVKSASAPTPIRRQSPDEYQFFTISIIRICTDQRCAIECAQGVCSQPRGRESSGARLGSEGVLADQRAVFLAGNTA